MMKIESVIGDGGVHVLRDAANHERIYRRIVGGAAWPKGGFPGFLVVVGEDRSEDYGFKVRHLRRLVELREYGGEAFLEPEPMFKAMAWLVDQLKVDRWYGMADRFNFQLCDYNRDQARVRQPRVSLHWPPEHGKGFEYFALLVNKRTRAQKTLHLGDSELGGKLGGLPSDLSGVKAAAHPEVAALFYAVAGVDLVPIRGGNFLSRSGGAADSTAGY